MLRRFSIFGWAALSSLALFAAPQSNVADEPAAEGQAAAADCDASAAKYKLVTKTICVPEITMERRIVKCVECRPECRECPTTIIKRIPHTTWVTKECCVMVPEHHTKTVCYTVCKPIIEKKEVTYCASVPVHCTTPCTRCVCKPVPVKEPRTICVDEGHWEEQPCCTTSCKPNCCKTACGKPDCCQPCTKKVWIPKMVTKNVTVTVWKPEWVTQNYNKVTTTFKCEQRTSVVNCVKGYTKECKTREVICTTYKATKVCKQVPCTTYTCEEVPFIKKYTVMVPHCVEKEICVPVCKMVTKTITCQVPCCD